VQAASGAARLHPSFQPLTVAAVLSAAFHVIVSVHLLPQGLNKRDPSIFDLYQLDMPTLTLTLHTVNPGEINNWLMDYEFQIRVGVMFDFGTRCQCGQHLLQEQPNRGSGTEAETTDSSGGGAPATGRRTCRCCAIEYNTWRAYTLCCILTAA
jgi:hypothetical protein